MKKLILLFSAIIIASSANAQITFQKTFGAFGGGGLDYAYCIRQTTDGGYIITGYTDTSGVDPDVYLIRTDAYGDMLWTKAYAGTGNDIDVGYSCLQTTDGGYLVAGVSDSSGTGNEDIYLIKTNANGDTLWTKAYGGNSWDQGRDIRQTTDGGYIIVGTTYSYGQVGDDVHLVKIDSIGNVLWTKTYGENINGSGWDKGNAVRQTTDGGYIITGETYNFGAGLYDIHLIKTNSVGDTLWTSTYGGISQDYGKSVQQTTDGGYIIVGYTISFPVTNRNVYLVKTDSVGGLLWSKTYGGSSWDYGESVQQTTDGGYIIGGHTLNSGGGSWDIYLIKTDNNGDTLWTKAYGGASSDVCFSVQQTTDGGFVITGRTISFGTGPGDVYLIKTDSLGNSGGCNEFPTPTIVSNPATQVGSAAFVVGSGGAITPNPTDVYNPTTVVTNINPIANAGFDANICMGDNTTLNASASGGVGTYAYSWSPTTGLSNPNISNPVANPISATTYTVTVSDSTGCTDMDSLTVTVNALPTVTATGTVSICIGASTTLTATGASTYSWDNGAGTGSSVSVSPTSTTTYTVTGTDGNGCTNTDQVTVTVNALPTVVATGTATICIGASTTLTAAGASTYSWDNGGGTGSSVSVSPTATTTYTVTGTDGNGCTNTDQVTVTVNALPTVTASGTATICSGASTTLSATGASTYNWDNGGGAGSSVSVSPTATTTYTVTGTDGNGCTGTDNVTVTVNSATADAGTDVDICIGLSTTLSASGGMSYSWTPTTGLSDPNIANPVASPTVTTSYIVTVTDANTCTDDDTVVVTVNPLPTADAGADVAICNGSSTTLSASGGVTYSWSPATGLSDPNIAGPVASPTATTTYIVTVDNGGCTDEDTVIVTVDPLPTVTATGTTAICDGESATLTVIGATTYSWDNGAGTGASVSVSPTATTTYTVTGTDGNSCTNTDAVVVTVNPNPTTPAINPSGNTLACSVNGSSYQWYFNSDTIVGATNQVYVATQSGFYSVTVIDANGCSATSGLLDVTVVGIQEIPLGIDVSVYPNPNTGEFSVEIKVGQVQDIELKIVNLVGQVIFEDVLKHYSGTYNRVIDLKGTAKGVYELQIQTKTGIINKNIILE